MARPTKPGFTGWLAANPLLVVTVAGVVFYAAVRYGQKTFYDRLGLTPADVGLSRIETLAQATGLAFDIALVTAILVGVPALGYWIVQRIDRRFPFPPSRSLNVALIAAVVFCAVFSVFFTVVWFRSQALWAANRVEAGKPVQLSFVSDTGIHAEKALITWTGDAPEGLADLPTHRLLYLGVAGGSVVLYDVDTKRSLRLPAGDVVVSIRP